MSIRWATHRSAVVSLTLPQSLIAVRLPVRVSVYQTVALKTDEGFLFNVLAWRTMVITSWLPFRATPSAKVTAFPLLRTSSSVSKHFGLHDEHDVSPGFTLRSMS